MHGAFKGDILSRPKISINWAMTIDGKIALPNRKQLKISSPEDFERVHRLRADNEIILVGINTILEDDPKLNVKKELVPGGMSPTRLVLDSQGRIPHDSLVLKMPGKTIIATTTDCSANVPGATMVRCGIGEVDLPELMGKLYDMSYRSLLVEGGETVLWSFLSQSLFDELTVYVGSMIVGGAGTPTPAGGTGIRVVDELIPLRLADVQKLGEGVVMSYVPARNGKAGEDLD